MSDAFLLRCRGCANVAAARGHVEKSRMVDSGECPQCGEERLVSIGGVSR